MKFELCGVDVKAKLGEKVGITYKLSDSYSVLLKVIMLIQEFFQNNRCDLVICWHPDIFSFSVLNIFPIVIIFIFYILLIQYLRVFDVTAGQLDIAWSRLLLAIWMKALPH